MALGPTPTGGMTPIRHDEESDLPDIALRVRALELLLIEKGYVDPAALDAIVETYETKIGPRNGARVVARSWADPAFRGRLLDDATAAIASLGYAGRQGEHMVAVENTAEVHNLVVCTLCSCYPWPVLGLPPVWYKSAPYRSRAVIDPRGVLAEFGVSLPADDEDPRLGLDGRDPLPRRSDAAGRDRGLERGALAALVTRDSMIGTGLAIDPQSLRGRGPHERRPGPRRHDGFWPDRRQSQRSRVFHAEWEKRVLALRTAAGALGEWNIDMARHANETLHPADYLSSSYYEIWMKGLEKLLIAAAW